MNRTISYSIAATTAVAGLFVALLFQQTQPQKMHLPVTEQSSPAVRSGPASPPPRAERSNEAWARALLKKTTELEERINKLQSQEGARSKPDPDRAEPVSLTPAERMARNQQRIQRIDRVLDSEPHDGQWSRDTARVLEDLFASVVPSGSTLSDTTCGETFCRVVVKHENRQARDDFEIFPRKVPGMGVRGLIEQHEDGTEQTTLYVVRKEYDNQEHPVRRRDQS